jgi:hypothetical protein
MIFFLIVGLIAFVIGFLSIVSSRVDQYLHRLFGESELDKKFLSARNRYVIRRYISGIRGIVGGIFCVAIYVTSNERLSNTLISWFHAIVGK